MTKIDWAMSTITLQIGALSLSLPAGSFSDTKNTFDGVVDGMTVHAEKSDIPPVIFQNFKHTMAVRATGAALTDIANPVQVTLTVGKRTGQQTLVASITP